jgi:hypothetical protein
MEAVLGISLYSYPYLKLAKMLLFSYYCLCLLFNKIREEIELPGSKGSEREMEGAEAGGRNGPNNVCTYDYMNF